MNEIHVKAKELAIEGTQLWLAHRLLDNENPLTPTVMQKIRKIYARMFDRSLRDVNLDSRFDMIVLALVLLPVPAQVMFYKRLKDAATQLYEIRKSKCTRSATVDVTLAMGRLSTGIEASAQAFRSILEICGIMPAVALEKLDKIAVSVFDDFIAGYSYLVRYKLSASSMLKAAERGMHIELDGENDTELPASADEKVELAETPKTIMAQGVV